MKLCFQSKYRNAIIFLSFVICLQDVLSLHVTKKPIFASKGKRCAEVLTKDLECPNIGSYPVAGACDYFARCFTTNNGIESEVDFCPDGHNFIAHRCVKSSNPEECPQKSCPLVNLGMSSVTGKPKELPKTTTKPVSVVNDEPFPISTIHPMSEPPYKPRPTRPLLNQLHPPKNGGTRCSKTFLSLLLTISIAHFVIY